MGDGSLWAQVGMGNQLLSALQARSFHTLAHGRPQLRQLTSKVLLVTTEDRGGLSCPQMLDLAEVPARTQPKLSDSLPSTLPTAGVRRND